MRSYAEIQADAAEITLLHIDQTWTMVEHLLLKRLGNTVTATTYDKELPFLKEAFDELVYEARKDARTAVNEFEGIAQRQHERLESTYSV